MNATEYNANLNKRRECIHSEGHPTFKKHDVTTSFNCMGCRKRKKGFRMKVTYTYERKNNPDKNIRYEWDRNLGTVCSEICYSMVVMRFS